MTENYWKCPPQVKDLPRDIGISVTCRSCGLKWGENVSQLIEKHRLGAEYIDLLEWKYRCQDEACGGLVRFSFDRYVQMEPYLRPEQRTLTQPRFVERLPYPSKSVVKPRTYEPPVIPMGSVQLPLPLYV